MQLNTIQLGLTDKSRAIKMLSSDMWLGSMKGMGTCVSLVPCCGQDGYLAQVPQHPHKDIKWRRKLYFIPQQYVIVE